jgi:hypothetical protein
MNTDDQNPRFLAHIRSELDRKAANLEADTVARLKRLRYSALEQHDSLYGNWRRLFRYPLMAVATGVVIAVVVMTNFQSSSTFHDGQTLADLEILTSSEQFEFFSDLDFYLWLTEKEDHAG